MCSLNTKLPHKAEGTKEKLIIKESQFNTNLADCLLQLGGMKQEFRVIVDHQRNGEAWIRDELTVCRWGEACMIEAGQRPDKFF